MALNRITQNVGDGLGGSLPAKFYQDTSDADALYPAPVLFDPNGVLAAALQPLLLQLQAVNANTDAEGIGNFGVIPTNGTNTAPVAVGAPPSGAMGIRLYAPSGVSIPFTIASSAAEAAAQFQAGAFKLYAQSGAGDNWDENLAGGMNVYVGSMTGLPSAPSASVPTATFRYI